MKLLDISKNQLSSTALTSALCEMEGLKALRAQKNRLGEGESDSTVRKGRLPPPLKTKMTMEDQPFEDIFPIENGDFPLSCSFSGVYYIICPF